MDLKYIICKQRVHQKKNQENDSKYITNKYLVWIPLTDFFQNFSQNYKNVIQ